MGCNGFAPNRSLPRVRGSEKCPGRSHRPGAFSWQYLVGADVHETQAAPGLNVLVAIAADVEGRTAVEMAVTMVMMTMTVMPTMAMTMMSAVAVTAMPMTTLATRGSRGHGGSTEGDCGDDGE